MKTFWIVLVFATAVGNAQHDLALATENDMPRTMKKLSDEKVVRQFARDYISQLNKKSWIEGIEKYLPMDNEAFLKEHTAFRKSFPNYKATIKRMFVEGNEVILWLNITANYTEDFRYEKSGYRDQLLWNHKAKNQALDWDETWYFNVVNGKFGDKWDMLKDNYAVLKGLEVQEK